MRLTKNPNGHLFHVHVICLFFFVCFCIFFLDRFLQSSHLQNYNFRDTLERFFQCYVMDKASCRSTNLFTAVNDFVLENRQPLFLRQ